MASVGYASGIRRAFIPTRVGHLVCYPCGADRAFARAGLKSFEGFCKLVPTNLCTGWLGRTPLTLFVGGLNFRSAPTTAIRPASPAPDHRAAIATHRPNAVTRCWRRAVVQLPHTGHSCAVQRNLSAKVSDGDKAVGLRTSFTWLSLHNLPPLRRWGSAAGCALVI